MNGPYKLVPAVGNEVDKLALALNVEDVASKFDKGQVEEDDGDSAGSRVTQDLGKCEELG